MIDKNKIPTYILIISTLGIVITQPILSILIATLSSINFSIYNKLTYKNNKSTLFGIDKDNNITQKFTTNIFKNNFIESKTDKFSVELVNLLLDLEEDTNYKTTSQSIVLKSLKKLEKEGYIDNLEAKKVNMSKNKSKLIHLFVNISMGNFDNLLKVSKKFDISFTKNDKVLTSDIINNFLNEHYEIIHNKDNSIKKVKYINKYKKIDEEKIQDVLEVKNNQNNDDEIKNINNATNLDNTIINNFDFNKYKELSEEIYFNDINNIKKSR